MPPRDWRVRLQDIVEAAERIERYTTGMDLEAFVANDMAADAVTRNLSIIGEATRYVPAEVQAKYTDVPWRLIRSTRNVLIHDYPVIDLEIVWQTIRDDLPPTVARIREILALEQDSDDPVST